LEKKAKLSIWKRKQSFRFGKESKAFDLEKKAKLSIWKRKQSFHLTKTFNVKSALTAPEEKPSKTSSDSLSFLTVKSRTSAK